MRILCFGGSFNPIHYGHLRTSEAIAQKLGYEQVLLIPSASPPHKQGSADLAAPSHRLAMCRLAAEEQPNLLKVSDIEINRAGPSYTIETARQLRLLGYKSVDWLIGADMVRILPSWHQAMKLLEEVNFVIMARPGWSFDWQALPVEFRGLESHVVEAPMVDISATDIRRRVREGLSIEGMTTGGVVRYIGEQGLYR
jgi:nicotinate-nucleotide adenylyltransferase